MGRRRRHFAAPEPGLLLASTRLSGALRAGHRRRLVGRALRTGGRLLGAERVAKRPRHAARDARAAWRTVPRLARPRRGTYRLLQDARTQAEHTVCYRRLRPLQD